MRRAENSWSTTPQAECILFFAQLVREQASIESLPSFRANSLDTVARLKEASFVLRDIESGKVSNLSAAPFLEEIQWSLKSDLALRAIADGAHSIILDRIAAKSTNSQLQTSIEFLYKKALPNYQKTIEGLITDVVLDTNSRHLLRNLTSSYISFLINNGYTRDYISKTIKESFFTKDMPKVGINTVRPSSSTSKASNTNISYTFPVRRNLRTHYLGFTLPFSKITNYLPIFRRRMPR